MATDQPIGPQRGAHSSQPEPSVQLVLASASPRRQDLLREAGYTFVVDPADIDESNHPPGLSPAELVCFLAMQKAARVAARHPTAVVLAADTLVTLGDEVLGKPADAAHARGMLGRLSGTSHAVITGVAVRAGERVWQTFVRSELRMRELLAAELDSYVASGTWQGKAGGYGIQDPDPFVTRTQGSATNIVGLPMEQTRELLAQAGVFPASIQS